MPPRKKAAAPSEPIVETVLGPVKPGELIKEYREIDAHLDAQSKQFQEFAKPYRERQEFIKNALLDMANKQGLESIKTEFGTAYKSTVMSHSITPDGPAYTNESGIDVFGREAVLDFMLENWEKYGNEHLKVSVPVEFVRQYMQDANGQLPPGVTTTFLTRINIRK